MVYRGRVEGGVVVLEGEGRPADGAMVEVVSVEPAAMRPEDDPLWGIPDLAVPCGIPDLSVNLDHYLYGHPKVSDVET